MKRTLLLICTLFCANVLMAQEQLATLKHNDSISAYYGQNAFVEAYNAAANGDIITLSDGIFNAPSTVQKGITVRGNGAVADTAQRKIGTYFMEIFDVQNLGDSLHFEAEGIYFALFRALSSFDTKLTRCYVDNMENCSGLQAMNCIIKGNVGGSSYINCVMLPDVYHLPHHAICNNCIISGYEYDGYEYESYPLYQFNNCVVIKKGASNTNTILNGAVNYSVLVGFTGSDSPASSGNVVMSLSDVFENWDGESLPTDLETYVLKSSVSDSIQGLDGTEVGIFGGFMPFDWRPSYSIIKRFNVANRTTADGKLSVDIEVISE